MKLLTPTEVKTSNQGEISRNLIRIETVRKALDEVERKLNDAEAKFDATLARQRVKWEDEKANHLQEIVNLETEIAALKKHREPLLIPIELDRKKAHDLLVEVNDALSTAREKESNLEKLSDLLQDKLDDFHGREQDFHDKEARLKIDISNVANQKTSVEKLSLLLTQKWEEFFTEQKGRLEKIDSKSRELDLVVINIEARESRQVAKDNYLNDKERAINDKYMSLLAAQQHLENGKRNQRRQSSTNPSGGIVC